MANAAEGHGGRRWGVTPCKREALGPWPQATVSRHFPKSARAHEGAAFAQSFTKHARLTAFWDGLLCYCFGGFSQVDLVHRKPRGNPMIFKAPILLVVQAAGGNRDGLGGGRLLNAPCNMAAANSEIHAEALEFLKNCPL